MSMEYILKDLNPVQKEAVTTTEGPLLIIAGAGSGKTRVLTRRVAYILGQRLAAPQNLLAVTFTNKAAGEMKDRINALLGQNIFSLTVATFHSFCARLLRQEAEQIGYSKNYVIFDEDDALAMVRNCVDQVGLSRNQFTPASLRRKISGLKNKMIDAETYAAKASGYFDTRTAQVYTMYERRLKECQAMDFDDLIYRAVQLLEGSEPVRAKYQERFKYILVDEYQDTNHSQYRLLRHLVGPHMNICVVGDEDQSIYGWRGADITNILNFEHDFPGARIIKMEQNYRSTQNILEAASAVIANNIDRKGKTLWTEAESGDRLRLLITGTALDESNTVIDEIQRRLAECPLKETVILYRTNAQSRAFEDVLRRRIVPYQIIGGVSFYQRKEIKDLVAYLKLLANPKDDISFQRIINYPRRGLGDSSIEKLFALAQATGKSLYEVGAEAGAIPELTSRANKTIAKFVEMMQAFRVKKETLNIADLTQQLIDELNLVNHLLEEDPLTGESRVENIEEFVAAAREFVAASPEPNLENFLAEISLYTDIDNFKETEDKLTLMTLHSAKGLEFDTVFLVGLEEGLFPLGRAIEQPKELEEERRLFYVGATRARKHLYLSMADERNRFGEGSSIPSRFLKELPPALVEVMDTRRYGRNGTAAIDQGGLGKAEAHKEDGGPHYEYEDEEAIRPGRIVAHPTFGRGKVMKAEGSGENLRLEIYFTGVGLKKVMAKFAKLKVVG
ncbi:ATP-dependent DNA helicase PcrA [Candidatus Zixiibacteriota bacterium]|nr:ATP-dependent DNA helicase PcrA [candidate division Zixibacteria bacterium]